MTQKPRVSVTIITLNEEKNLPDAIRSVSWADEVLVIDSGSSDRTVEIATSLGAKVLSHPWPGYGQQKNYAQDQASHDWILNLDADERMPTELGAEIQRKLQAIADGTLDAQGFSMPRKTYYLGRWIRYGGWYPNYLVRMADRRKARWSESHVHEELLVRGKVEVLEHPFDHFTFSSIEEQVRTNLRYARLGSEDLRNKGKTASIWKLLVKPLGKFIETYFMKRGFLDGLSGFIISINAAHSMFLKYAYLHEERIRRVP